MNANAKKWVRALRSGKYKQGRGQLCQDGKFCCLGVACDLAVKAKVIPPGVEHNGETYYVVTSLVLPEAVRIWLGLNTEVGQIGFRSDLALLNDQGKSFKTIAKIIESEPEGLFAEK